MLIHIKAGDLAVDRLSETISDVVKSQLVEGADVQRVWRELKDAARFSYSVNRSVSGPSMHEHAGPETFCRALALALTTSVQLADGAFFRRSDLGSMQPGLGPAVTPLIGRLTFALSLREEPLGILSPYVILYCHGDEPPSWRIAIGVAAETLPVKNHPLRPRRKHAFHSDTAEKPIDAQRRFSDLLGSEKRPSCSI